ncbi:MAG: type II CAAX endopeptidase family protein [Pseudomonadota bacterium]
MTPSFERFIHPARAKPELWRLFAGCIVMLGVYAGFIAGFFFLLRLASQRGLVAPVLQMPEIAATPWGLVVLLATFIGLAVAPMVAVRLLHKRGPGTLFGRAAVVLRDFATAFVVVGLILSLSVGIWTLVYDATPGLPPATWLGFLPLALLLVLIQTGAEELVFRGYLQQQLAARFASPLIWAVFPSLLFGLAHYAPAEMGANAWLVVGVTATFGLLAADLTAKTGSLGAAWGFHFANNCLALLVLATEGTLTGLALYVTPYKVDDTSLARSVLALDVAMMVLAWWVIRRVCRAR